MCGARAGACLAQMSETAEEACECRVCFAFRVRSKVQARQRGVLAAPVSLSRCFIVCAWVCGVCAAAEPADTKKIFKRLAVIMNLRTELEDEADAWTDDEHVEGVVEV